jgi:ankyrin repeat protein
MAVKKGYFNVTKALIEKAPHLINSTNNQHWYPLHIAVYNNNSNILKLLLEKEADPNALARYLNENSTVQLFVSALNMAAEEGYIGCVNSLLKHGAKINHQDSKSNTALHYTARTGKYEVVKVLVENGANISLKTRDNKTALDIAISANKKNQQLIDYLNEHAKND